MSDKTFGVTSEDIRSLEAQESKYHDGKTPKDSDVSALKVTPAKLLICRHIVHS